MIGVNRLLLTTIAAVLLAGWDAHAVITRHDLSDSDYIVADADYPALVNLMARVPIEVDEIESIMKR